MTIGNRIKAVRESEGLNQRDFAVSIKIGQSTLAMFETGQREPKDIHIEQICSKYGINEHWLRTNEGDMYKSLPPEDEVAAVISNVLEDIGCENSIYTLVKELLLKYDRLDPKSKKVIDKYADDVIRGYNEKREES